MVFLADVVWSNVNIRSSHVPCVRCRDTHVTLLGVCPTSRTVNRTFGVTIVSGHHTQREVRQSCLYAVAGMSSPFVAANLCRYAAHGWDSMWVSLAGVW